MGDRCYVSVTVAASDKERLLRCFGGSSDEEIENDDGSVSLVDYEANYGHGDALREMAEEGVSFYGESLTGGDYGPLVFASDGVEFVEVNAGWSGGPVAEIAADGETDAGQVAAARHYWLVRHRVEAAIRSAAPASAAHTG